MINKTSINLYLKKKLLIGKNDGKGSPLTTVIVKLTNNVQEADKQF